MISYPGKVVARFGRYEAIEELASKQGSRQWRGWDPYLERYVTIVELGDVDPAELFDRAPDLEGALGEWTGDAGFAADRIVDFDPGSTSGVAFVVTLPPNEAKDGVATATPSTGARRRARDGGVLTKSAPSMSLSVLYGIALLLLGAIAGAVGGRLLEAPVDPALPVLDTERTDQLPTPVAAADVSTPESAITATATATAAAAADTAGVPAPGACPGPDCATPSRSPTRPPFSPSPSVRPEGPTKVAEPLSISFVPPPGRLALSAGKTSVTARPDGGGAVRYEWRLDGRVIGKSASIDLATMSVANGAELKARVFDQSGVEVATGAWTIAAAPRPAAAAISITVSPQRVRPGDKVELKSSVTGEQLECEWLIAARPRSRFCKSFTWEVPPSQASGPVAITLRSRPPGAGWRSATASIEVVSGETVRPPATAVARPSAARAAATLPATEAKVPSVPTPKMPTSSAPPVAVAPPTRPKPATSATDPRQAIAAYYAAYEQRLRSRPRARDARFSYEVKSLAPQGAGWVAEVERRVGIPGQQAEAKTDRLEVVREGAGLVARSQH